MKQDKILLDHGSGGKVSHRLISDMMLPLFNNPVLSQLDDGAILELGGKRLAFSTDTFTVDPIFFPGGSIGELAVTHQRVGVDVAAAESSERFVRWDRIADTQDC